MLKWVYSPFIEKAEIKSNAQHATPARESEYPIAVGEEISQSQMKDLVAARERLEHEGKRGVLIWQHILQRIHHKREFFFHCPLTCAAPAACLAIFNRVRPSLVSCRHLYS